MIVLLCLPFLCFFFCIFLTSLIRLILWLKLSYIQEAGGGRGMQGGVCPGKAPQGPAPVTVGASPREHLESTL